MREAQDEIGKPCRVLRAMIKSLDSILNTVGVVEGFK